MIYLRRHAAAAPDGIAIADPGVPTLESDERIQRLRQSRSYCKERLQELKEEIARLYDEGLVLKARIGTAPDEAGEGHIRRRRRYLGRRIDELKVERAALIRELEEANAQLEIPVGGVAHYEHAPETTESATSTAE